MIGQQQKSCTALITSVIWSQMRLSQKIRKHCWPTSKKKDIRLWPWNRWCNDAREKRSWISCLHGNPWVWIPQKYEKVARQGGFRIFSDCESMKCKAIWSIMLETAINDRIRSTKCETAKLWFWRCPKGREERKQAAAEQTFVTNIGFLALCGSSGKPNFIIYC